MPRSATIEPAWPKRLYRWVRPVSGCLATATLFGVAVAAGVSAQTAAANEPDPDRPPPTDYLSFAQGALPVSIDTFGAGKPAGLRELMLAIDGAAAKYVTVAKVDPDGGVQMLFELPATTRFESFAVPEIHETPSPNQTFFREVLIEGSNDGPHGPWQTLAQAELGPHPEPGMATRIPAERSVPVRWVKLRLSGGQQLGGKLMFYEFSEIQGFGNQDPVQMADHFTGIWKGRGLLTELKQQGPTVTGCIDRDGEPFEGTVSGNILRGRSIDPSSGVVSLFVLMVADDGSLKGVRSTNGAPFKLNIGGPAPAGTRTRCSTVEPAPPGCDSVLHGINFGFDSAAIEPESEPLLQQLFAGLQGAAQTRIRIEGHTSSEGSDTYNQTLSQRRAQAVVDDLVQRGLDPDRIQAVGRGEKHPIADNTTESGRSLNRRVEVHCDP